MWMEYFPNLYNIEHGEIEHLRFEGWKLNFSRPPYFSTDT